MEDHSIRERGEITTAREVRATEETTTTTATAVTAAAASAAALVFFFNVGHNRQQPVVIEYVQLIVVRFVISD